MKVRGFTLIELLVVIAIIGLLSSIVIASLNEARIKAEDSRRVQEVRQVMSAIELFASDNNGTYPTHAACSTASNCYFSNALTDDLVPKYLPTMPVNTGYAPDGYRYMVCPGGQQYGIMMITKGGGGWCNVKTTSGIFNYTTGYSPNTTGCFMSANSVPSQGWCEDEI